MARAILFDSTLCAGCRACEEACAERWGHPYNEKIGREERLSAHKLTTVRTVGESYLRKMCMHCAEPSCASACPVGALQKTGLGPVVYDAGKCMGCRYCMIACPFAVPTYTWNETRPVVKKCDGCFPRQSQGKPTACTEACPMGATIGGEREELIAEARKRIAQKPDQYVHHIYGLEEIGGTSVLILSAVPFEKLGLPVNLGTQPLPQLTWNVLSHVPDVVSIGGVLLGGLAWLSRRRNEVVEEEGAEAAARRRA